jgi:hypothetical protein
LKPLEEHLVFSRIQKAAIHLGKKREQDFPITLSLILPKLTESTVKRASLELDCKKQSPAWESMSK